jgi:hypothetical protein
VRCKENDLAIVIRADGAPAAVGRTVLVVERSPDVDGLPAWTIQFQGAAIVLSKETGAQTLGCDADCPDAWLMPICGGPIEDETPIETNIPEALRLALAIESRWRA